MNADQLLAMALSMWMAGIALCLVVLGLVAWACAMWQRRREMNSMRKQRAADAVKPFQGVDFGVADGQRFIRCDCGKVHAR